MTDDPNAETGLQPCTLRDERFEQAMAELSRRLGERLAGRPISDPLTALKQRQAALKAYDLARFHRLRFVLGSVGAAAASACVTWLVVMVAAPDRSAFDAPASPVATAGTQPAPPPAAPVVVAAAPSPPTVLPPSPPSSSPPSSPSSSPTGAASVDPAPDEAPLQRDEIKELQSRLRSFGFASGPIDGAAGAMTREAALRYQQSRGQPETGAVDRQLLAQLRQDPAPLAPPAAEQRIARSPAAVNASVAGSFDPFAPVKMAGAGITRFLQSLTR